MCENGIFLLAKNDNLMTMRIVQTDCKRWSCPTCAPQMRSTWANKIMAGIYWYRELEEEDYWITLTLTARANRRGRDTSVADFRQRWPRLYAKMKRVQEKLLYVVITEQHKDTTEHLHIIINWRGEGTEFKRAKYDKSGRKRTKWRMKDEAASVGLGYQAKIRVLAGELSAASYATKYMTKAMENIEYWPAGHRLVRTSQDWPELTKRAYMGDEWQWSPLSDKPGAGWLEMVTEIGYTVLNGWSQNEYAVSSEG